MTTPPTTAVRSAISAILTAGVVVAGVLAAGCASPGAPDRAEPERQRAEPARPPAELSSALRCVDQQLLSFGVRDLSLVIEDVVDATGRPLPAARDALVEAVSDMTVRSRAIRIRAERRTRSAGGGAPVYTMRGSASEQGFQLAVLQDDVVVPGIGSRSTVRRLRQGAEVVKLGTPFALPATATPPARGLVELAAIETVGRLGRVPWWTCIGVADGREVDAEIQDWYDAMADRPAELIGYFQRQLALRGAYDGPADGRVSAPFKDAVIRYRQALGQSPQAQLSMAFYKAYLGADHDQIAEQVRAPNAAAYASNGAAPAATSENPPAQVAAAPSARTYAPPSAPNLPPIAPKDPVMGGRTGAGGSPASAPDDGAGIAPGLALRVAPIGAPGKLARGQVVQFGIRPTRDAYVYCYMQDENRTIQRIFPNRFRGDSRVDAAEGLQLPGPTGGFEIVVNKRGVPEYVMCVATPRDVLAALPRVIAGRDFEPIAVRSLDQVRSAFATVTGGAMAQDQYVMAP